MGTVGKLGKVSKKKNNEEEAEVTLVDLAQWAPREIGHGMLGVLLPSELPEIPEVKLYIDIKDLKFGNKKVAAAEVITIYKGNKTAVPVPFSKPLDFKFMKVEDEMVFKFAVTGSGDLLGFIYVEIPPKFRTVKEFKLDDWFPIKQIKPDEDDEIVRVQNFVARIVIRYKANRKIKLTDMFKGNVPKAKQFQMMATNLKQRINTINNDMNNFNEEGFKYLHDFEKRILHKRLALHKRHLSPVRHKNLKAKEFHNQQRQVHIKGKNVVKRHDYVVTAKTRASDFYNKDGGKYKLKRGANTQEAIDELLKELTLAKKELADRNYEMKALEEQQMTPDNRDLKRTIEQMKDDLQSDKSSLTKALCIQTKDLHNAKKQNKEEHDGEMEDCRGFKSKMQGVVDQYKNKYKDMQRLEAKINRDKDFNEELAEKVRGVQAGVDKEAGRLDLEREAINQLEEELDGLKAKMMVERHKIHKRSKGFGDERGEISIKERQLKTQQEFLKNQREDFETEKEKAYKEIAQAAREIDEIKKLTGLDKNQLDQFENEYKERLGEVEAGVKKNKMESVRVWRDKNKLEGEVKDFLKLKKIADEEKALNQRALEEDFDFIEGQLNEMKNRKTDLDELKDNLEVFEVDLGDNETELKKEINDFNKNKASFFRAIGKSSFRPSDLERIAREHGIDPDIAKKAAANQRAEYRALESKKQAVRASVMGLQQGDIDKNRIALRRQTTTERRSTMVNRMSMAADDLGGMGDEYGNKGDINKFLDGLFNQACADFISSGKKSLGTKYDDTEQKLMELEKKLADTRLDLAKSKMAFFIRGIMSVIANDKERKASKKREEEQEEEAAIKRRQAEDREVERKKAEEAMKNMNRRQQAQFEADRKKELEAQKKRDRAEILRKRKEAKEQADWEAERGQKGLGGVFGMMANKQPTSTELKRDLLQVADATIQKLEKELETLEHPVEIQALKERLKFLKTGKKCIDNVFGIALFMDKNTGRINDKYIREMEKENPDFDFETIRRRYERKIIALVEYIKQIRSNYNFFNHNVDRNILIN